MTIAGSIFLIAVGAILYFATNLRVAHVRRSRREAATEDRREPREPY
jgi:hypothetical protein